MFSSLGKLFKKKTFFCMAFKFMIDTAPSCHKTSHETERAVPARDYVRSKI